MRLHDKVRVLESEVRHLEEALHAVIAGEVKWGEPKRVDSTFNKGASYVTREGESKRVRIHHVTYPSASMSGQAWQREAGDYASVRVEWKLSSDWHD